MPQRHPILEQHELCSQDLENLVKMIFPELVKKSNKQKIMPQRHPADTQQLQEYYQSPEFEDLVKKMFPGLLNKK